MILISLMKFAFSTYLLFFYFIYKALKALIFFTVYQDSVKTVVQELHPHPLVNFTESQNYYEKDNCMISWYTESQKLHLGRPQEAAKKCQCSFPKKGPCLIVLLYYIFDKCQEKNETCLSKIKLYPHKLHYHLEIHQFK